MKARLEDGTLMVDFNHRGWNPEEVVEMTRVQFEVFLEKCYSDYENLSDINMSQMIAILIEMAREEVL